MNASRVPIEEIRYCVLFLKSKLTKQPLEVSVIERSVVEIPLEALPVEAGGVDGLAVDELGTTGALGAAATVCGAPTLITS